MEAASGGVDVRRRQMLSENRAVSANLRDLLGIKQDDNNNNNGSNMNNCDNNNGNLVGLTLGAVLSGDMRSMSMPVQSNRTLLDIIRDEPFGKNGNDGKKSWKLLKQKLKIRRAGSGSGWTSSVSVRASDGAVNENNNRVMARRNSTGLISNLGGSTQQIEPEGSSSSTSLSVMMRSSSAVTLDSSRAVDRGSAGDFRGRDAEEGRGESPEGGAEEQPVRMSLMALLEETDRQMGLDGSVYMMDDDEEDEFVDADVDADVDVNENVGVVVDRDGGGQRVDEYNSCCVCMVRHKGAAFIPCGHTFCRLCSRELWVQRGNCPLCNHLIMEILDIF